MNPENKPYDSREYISSDEREKVYQEIIKELQDFIAEAEERKKEIQEELEYVKENEILARKEGVKEDYDKRIAELEAKIWEIEKIIIALQNLREEAEEGKIQNQEIRERMKDLLRDYKFKPKERL